MASWRFGKLWTEALCLGSSPEAAGPGGGGGAGSQKAGVRRQESGGRRQKSEGRRLKWQYDELITGGGHLCSTAILAVASRAGRPCYVGAGAAKKECLFLTNEAIMLLKTKGRKNERSQLKTKRTGTRG